MPDPLELPSNAYDPERSPPTRRAVNPSVRYDGVWREYGGSLTAEGPPEGGRKARRLNATGRAFLRWFDVIGHSVDLDEAAMEALTAEAHRLTPGRQAQWSFDANRRYGVRWIAAIYRLAGVERVPLPSELEAAHAFHMWKVVPDSAADFGPRTLRTLNDLRDGGVMLGVISNNSGYVEDALFANGTRSLFRIVLDSARVGVVKPSSELFDRAAALTGSPDARFLYVGDNPEADVVGATQAGWDAAWLSESHGPVPPGVVHCIRCLDELPGICLKA